MRRQAFTRGKPQAKLTIARQIAGTGQDQIAHAGQAP
jgi:hypothetical protein